MSKLENNKKVITELIKNNDGQLDAVDLVDMCDIGAWFVSIAIMDLKAEGKIIKKNGKYHLINDKPKLIQ